MNELRCQQRSERYKARDDARPPAALPSSSPAQEPPPMAAVGLRHTSLRLGVQALSYNASSYQVPLQLERHFFVL